MTITTTLDAPKTLSELLGHGSEIVRVPTSCIWVATGNNPALSNEMTRRTVRIRLDAKTDRPWLREKFKHPDLRTWMAENRGKLAGSALTLIREVCREAGATLLCVSHDPAVLGVFAERLSLHEINRAASGQVASRP